MDERLRPSTCGGKVSPMCPEYGVTYVSGRTSKDKVFRPPSNYWTSSGSNMLTPREGHTQARDSATTLDGAFSHDLERIVGSKEPLAPPSWD